MSFARATMRDELASEPRPERSLSFRLNAWYVAAFIASLGLLAAFAMPILRSALERDHHVVLERRMQRHVALLTAGLPTYRDAVERSQPLEEPDQSVRVRDRDGRVVYQRGDMTARFVAARIVGDLRLEMAAPPVRWEAVMAELRPGMLALGCGALLIAVLGGHALTRRGLRPVRELALTTREVIRSGDLSARVPERGSHDELDAVAALFNRMLARNQKLVLGMREALDNVSHDLRTPLTRLRGTAEVALRTNDPQATREALADCIEESERVLVMLRTLMDISEAETGIMRLEYERVDVSTLSEEVVDLYSHVAEEAGVSLSVTAVTGATVRADRARLRQVIANLVDNAIKYTPPGGRVEVRPIIRAAAVGVEVQDTGEGIAAEAVPRIWDRLYRADRSRSRRGLGLGLALVKAIVEAHGGAVRVDTELGAGYTFTALVPR